MAGIIRSYDGMPYEFPEGTTDEQIDGYFAKKFGAPASPPQTGQVTPPPGEKPSYTEELTRGATKSGYRTLGNIAEATADAVGVGGQFAGSLPFTQLVKPFVGAIQEKYQGTADTFREAEAKAPSPTVQDFREGFSSLDNFARYTIGMIGTSLPETALGMAGGAVGSGVRAYGAANQILQRGLGAAGAFAGSSVATLPSFYGQNLQSQREAGVPEDQLDHGAAFTAALSQSQLSAAFDALLVGKIGKLALPGGVTTRERFKAVLAAPFVGAAMEVPTEIAQEALEMYQANPELLLSFSPEVQEHLLQTGVGAAIVGGALSGATETGVQLGNALMDRARQNSMGDVTPPREDTGAPVPEASDYFADVLNFADQVAAQEQSPPQRQRSFFTTQDGHKFGIDEDGRAAQLDAAPLALDANTVFVSSEEAASLREHQAAGQPVVLRNGKIYPVQVGEDGKMAIKKSAKENPIRGNSEPKKGYVPISVGRPEDKSMFIRDFKVHTPVTEINKVTPVQSTGFNIKTKAVDETGKPVKLYRGISGDASSNFSVEALSGEPRENYSTFTSTSPYVAASYGNPQRGFEELMAGTIAPMHVIADEIIEFPVEEKSWGRHFDKFKFDEMAKKLKPGQVLVARNVLDIGPRARADIDQEQKYSYPSDIYAWGKGTKTVPAFGTLKQVSSNIDSKWSPARTIREVLGQIAPGAEVRFMDEIPNGGVTTTLRDDGSRELRTLGMQWANVIDLALQYSGDNPEGGAANNTALHEAIHYLDLNGFFTPEEQAIIDEAMPQLAEIAAKESEAMSGGMVTPPSWYMGEGATTPYEKGVRRAEALALAGARYMENRLSEVEPTSPIGRVFQKLKDFFNRLGRAVRRATGKSRVEDIFEEVMAGKVGRRTTQHQGFSSLSRHPPIVAAVQEAAALAGAPNVREFAQWLNGTEVVDEFGMPKVVYLGARDGEQMIAAIEGADLPNENNPFGAAATLFSDSTQQADPGRRTMVPELRAAEAEMRRAPDSLVAQANYTAALKKMLDNGPLLIPNYVKATNLFDFKGRVPDFLKNKFPELSNVRRLEHILPDKSMRPLMEQVARAIEQEGYNGIKYSLGGANNFALFSYDTAPLFTNDPGKVSAETIGEVRSALQAIKGWHGSPYIFDAFDIDKIGTGEGNAAFGWGLYFSDTESIARGYKRDLSTPERGLIDGKPYNNRNPIHRAAALAWGGDLERAIDELMEAEDAAYDAGREAQARKIGEALEAFRSRQFPRVDEGGAVYEVTLDVEPEELLDWDKPLSEQTEKVREAAQKVFGDVPNPSSTYIQGVTKEIAQKLREAGIPGIRYLDGLSRYAKEGTYNYVIFDDSLVRIESLDGNPVSKRERDDVLGRKMGNVPTVGPLQQALPVPRPSPPHGGQTPPPVSPPQLPPPDGSPPGGRNSELYFGDGIGAMGRFLSSARHVAARYTPFAKVFHHAQKIKGLRTYIQAEAMRTLEAYDLVSDKTNIHAALELNRHKGKPERGYSYDVDGNVVFVNDLKDLQMTKKGDVIRLSDAEFKGYLAYRNTMKGLFSRLAQGLIREGGKYKLPIGWDSDGKVQYSEFHIPNGSTSRDIREQAKMLRQAANRIKPKIRKNPALRQVFTDLLTASDNMKRLATKIGGMEKNMDIPYAPFMRFGRAMVFVKDPATGKTIHMEGVEGVESLTGFVLNKGKVNERRDALREQYPGMDITYEANVREEQMRRVTATPESLDTLMGMLSTDDLATYKDLRNQLQAILKDRGFNAHLNQANLIPGYTTDFDQSAQRYINLIASAIAKFHYGSDVQDLVNQMPGRNEVSDPKAGLNGVQLKKFGQEYADYIVSPEEELAWIRQLGFVSTLGLAPDSAILQSFSIWQFLLPQMAGFVGPAKAAKYVGRATSDAFKIMKNYYKFMGVGGAHGIKRELFGKQFVDMSHPDIVGFLLGDQSNPNDPAARKRRVEVDALSNAYQSGNLKALLTLEALGITSEARTRTLTGKASTYLHGASELAGHFFNVVETFSRITAFLSHYRALRDNPNLIGTMKEFYALNNKLFAEQIGGGVTDSSIVPSQTGNRLLAGNQAATEVERIEAAKFLVEDAFGLFGKENTPRYMRIGGAGGILKAVGQFQSWVQQMLEWEIRLGRTILNPQSKGASRRIAATQLASIMMMLGFAGGIFGNFAGQQLKDLYELLYKFAMKEDLDVDRAIREWSVDALGNNQVGKYVGELMTKGGLSTMTGIDLSSRTAIGDMPMISTVTAWAGGGRPGETLGVPGSMLVGNTARISDALSSGVPIGQAIMQNLPFRALGNLANAYYWNTEGVYTTGRNRVLAPPGAGKGSPELSYWDIGAKALGFTSKNVAEEREIFYTQMRAANAIDDKAKLYREKIIDALTKSINARRTDDPEQSKEYRALAREVMDDLRQYNKSVPLERRIKIDTNSIEQEVINNLQPNRRALRAAPQQRKRKVNDLRELYP